LRFTLPSLARGASRSESTGGYVSAVPNVLADLRDSTAQVLRRLSGATEDTRTEILREAARLLVDARAHFFDAQGETDWRGRTYAYRRFVGEVFSAGNVPRDEIPTVQAAIRYHIGNALRERLSAEELTAIGLRPEGPRERSIEKRRNASALAGVLQGGAVLDDVDDALRALSAVSSALVRIPPSLFSRATNAERREAVEALGAIEDLAGSLKSDAERQRRRPE
jgi:hypothetical protein